MTETAAAASSRMTLRVLTLNVWNTSGPEERQARLRSGVASLDPDLVALQEVVQNDSLDQLKEILADTPLTGVHQREVHRDAVENPDYLQNGIGTRWVPTSVTGVALPGTVGYEVALAAVVPLPIGVDVLFLNVKPSAAFTQESDRCRQALAITELEASLRATAPTVLAGDFDATPDAECMRFYTGKTVLDGRSVYFRDSWPLGGDGSAGMTWGTRNPWVVPNGGIQAGHARRIDYVLVGAPSNHPEIRSSVRDCRVVLTDPPASDHYGVLAEIDLEVR